MRPRIRASLADQASASQVGGELARLTRAALAGDSRGVAPDYCRAVADRQAQHPEAQRLELARDFWQPLCDDVAISGSSRLAAYSKGLGLVRADRGVEALAWLQQAVDGYPEPERAGPALATGGALPQ